jgi:sugar fermentation stimulation protein A
LGPLIAARFLRRLNRFAALVEVGRHRALAHVANSGRLRELLVHGARVYLRPQGRAGRSCPYDLALVRASGTLVSADARLPNALVAGALAAGGIAPLREFGPARPEVRHGRSRLDFVLGDSGRRCLVEAKSVTLVEGGVALFPDAPTVRGRRHVEALARACRRGAAAAVIFVVQRADAVRFRPNVEADTAFARALSRAAKAGVRVLAYRCRVTRQRIVLGDPLPVVLPAAVAGRQPQCCSSKSPIPLLEIPPTPPFGKGGNGGIWPG